MKESRERGSRGTVFRPSVHCHDSVESCDDCLLEVDGRTEGRTEGRTVHSRQNIRFRCTRLACTSKRNYALLQTVLDNAFPWRDTLLPSLLSCFALARPFLPPSLPLSMRGTHWPYIFGTAIILLGRSLPPSLAPASVRPSVHPSLRPLTRPLGNPVPPSASTSSSIAIVPG